MNSLFVDKRGIELRVDGNALTVYENHQRVTTIPLSPLKRVFLHGDVQLHARVLAKLGEYGIGVVVLYGQKADPLLFMPGFGKDASRRQAQYRISQDSLLSLSYARQLIGEKLAGHLTVLREIQSVRPAARFTLTQAITQLEDLWSGPIRCCSNKSTLLGLEGAAAACYFGALVHSVPSSLGFTGRNRRPPKDPFNVLLSLGYTLLYSEAVLAIHAAGLDPYLGFFHEVAHGRASLACDLMEPLRHEIDRLCWRLVSTQELTVRDFSQSETGCQLNKAGRTRFYQAYELAMTTLRKKMWQQLRGLGQLLEGQPFDFTALYLSELEQGR